jgi:hypothetical protein
MKIRNISTYLVSASCDSLSFFLERQVPLFPSSSGVPDVVCMNFE